MRPWPSAEDAQRGDHRGTGQAAAIGVGPDDVRVAEQRAGGRQPEGQADRRRVQLHDEEPRRDSQPSSVPSSGRARTPAVATRTADTGHVAVGTNGCLMYGYQRPSTSSERLIGKKRPSGSNRSSGGGIVPPA